MPTIKKVIKEVERLKGIITHRCGCNLCLDKDEDTKLNGIKQTVKAINNDCDLRFDTATKSDDFQKLKKLLGVE